MTSAAAWIDPLSLYCERTSAALWSEPLNAVSNIGFFIAAWLLRRHLRQQHRSDADLHIAYFLIAGIGLGSLSFHLWAQRWAVVLDVLFIALYMHFYFAFYLHRCVGLRWRWAWLGAPAFALFAWCFGQTLAPALAKMIGVGAEQYLPAITALVFLAAWATRRQVSRSIAIYLFAAAGIFCISLVFRQLDRPLCTHWQWGTHFVWHLLNAVVLWLTAQAMFRVRVAVR